MNEVCKSLCIIPARGGSKRIPGKNLRLLNGRPLIAYTIDAVVGSNVFSDVFVSSDLSEILEVAKMYGAQPDKRPSHLADDRVKAVEVVYEFLERMQKSGHWDVVAMCLPTCPFRTIEDVKNAMALFRTKKELCPRLLGVTPCDFPPQLALKSMHDEDHVDMREPECYGFSTRSQDLEELYFPNGSIYISTVKEFMKAKTFFGRPMLSYIMPHERSFDIDYPYQLQLAECMMQALARNKP